MNKVHLPVHLVLLQRAAQAQLTGLQELMVLPLAEKVANTKAMVMVRMDLTVQTVSLPLAGAMFISVLAAVAAAQNMNLLAVMAVKLAVVLEAAIMLVKMDLQDKIILALAVVVRRDRTKALPQEEMAVAVL